MIKLKGLLLLAILSAFWSCKKDECEGKEYYTADSRVIEAIPYTDKQVVRFLTNRGDVILANVKRSFEVERSDFMCDEGLLVNFNTGDPLPYMQIIYRASSSNGPVIQINFTPNRDHISYGMQILLLEGEKMGAFLPGEYRKAIFHDTITIEGHSYTKVVEIVDTAPAWKGIVHLFYSKAYGIIQFKTGEGLVVSRQ
ncbi:hypothetical protein [Salmonirosea aquatica]|uniref:Uncharacterized protein n=1 Tax=Salmonirosea aquatica TaxID=2654236 RepID=A0A7C9FRP0_9BACT|nr:hypothetical protein [Cytophagaceae bacterium SJW1-29]